jgi:hypothetical protein
MSLRPLASIHKMQKKEYFLLNTNDRFLENKTSSDLRTNSKL